ncbi:hypothetical protein F383_06334 [Gossypium arboreum]|uniref:Uncharacterized protein n=1 Tax=Gossypium arboreum TaxID=29729 RepID=A0A0B0NH15_GOSAR|nr:hypothetical protein F383_06334 [Gossypium arboreum]
MTTRHARVISRVKTRGTY